MPLYPPGKSPRQPSSGRLVGPQRAWKVWRRGKIPNPARNGSLNSWSPSLQPIHYAYWAILSSLLQVFRLPLYTAAVTAVLELKDKMYNTLADKLHLALSIFHYFKVLSAQTVREVPLAPRPLFPSEKEHKYRLNRKLGGPHIRSGSYGEEKDVLDLWESNYGVSTLQPSHYIHYDIPAPSAKTIRRSVLLVTSVKLKMRL